MKKLSLKTSLILAAVAVSVSAGGVYALTNRTETPKPDQSAFGTLTEIPKEEQTTPTTVEPVVIPEPTPAPTPKPTETPVVVRSFEEIVKDYPNMSTGAPGFPECAGYLKAAYPERFEDSNREESIRFISEKFINVCAAIDLKTTRAEMKTLQFFWGR